MKSPNPQSRKPDTISRQVLEMERALLAFRRIEIDATIRELRALRFARARNLRLRRNGRRP